jgi:hypothetical protein
MTPGEWTALIVTVGGLAAGAWKALVLLIAAARADALKDRDLARAELKAEAAECKRVTAENAQLIARIGVLERDLEDMAHEREKLLPFLPAQVRRAVETGFMPLDELPK